MRRGRTHDGRALEGGGGAEHEGYENALHLGICGEVRVSV